MSNFSASYLSNAIREDGLEGSLTAVGSINDLIDALVHLEGLQGTANFQRDFDRDRRGTLSKAIDVVRDTKKIASETGQSIDTVFRTIGNIRIGLGVGVVILFISIWVGTIHISAGFGTFIVLSGLAWYFWSWVKLTLGNVASSGRSLVPSRR
jgi:hypothetical protein